MIEYEYEVVFGYDTVNVVTIVWVTEEGVGDQFDDLQQKAEYYAELKIQEQAGLDVSAADEVSSRLTATIGGN